MQTRRHTAGWIITTDPHWTTDPDAAAGTSSQSMAGLVEAYKVWTGAAWALPSVAPLSFPTQRAAADYIVANDERLTA